MSRYLGVDTSNYTTSLAVYDSEMCTFTQARRLLPVAPGQLGLRQSDALFHHTAALPELFTELFDGFSGYIAAVGVSEKPRDAEGSYMPCFLAGVSVATAVSASMRAPLRRFSHQAGHIAAALFSSGKTELIGEKFIAFHVSGGTTEALLVTPDDERIFHWEIIGGTSDLNAGQAVDRAGAMLGLAFPAGAALEKLALESDRTFNIRPSLRDAYCSFSGLENKCADMLAHGEKPCDIARFCIEYITETLCLMTERIADRYGRLPIVFSGGVTSDSIIRNRISDKFGAFFAQPSFSTDNAAGIAFLTYFAENKAL